MHPQKPRIRRWYLSSKALLVAITLPVIGVSMLDGTNWEEIGGLLAVMACGLMVAVRADRLQHHLDHIEKRLRHPPK